MPVQHVSDASAHASAPVRDKRLRGGKAPGAAVSIRIPGSLSRFSCHQVAVLSCARKSDRLTDLAVSYPLLLFLLATNYGSAQDRIAVAELIENGRPLGEAAKAMGLPLCLKKVPPEACRKLPQAQWSAAAGRSLGNQIPSGSSRIARWLEATFFSTAACNEAFGLWIGKQKTVILADDFDAGLLRPLAMYAWHSACAESPLHWLAFTRWCPQLSLATALLETRYWLNRVKLLAYFGDTAIGDTWLEPGRVDEFEIVALTDFWKIMEERMDMRNCVDCWADKLARNGSRLFGVRHRGRKVATLEIEPWRGDSAPRIAQLKGPGNAQVSLDVWHAASAWVAMQADRKWNVSTTALMSLRGTERLRELTAPYWRAVAADEDQRTEAASLSFRDLDTKLGALARRAGVHGWQFR